MKSLNRLKVAVGQFASGYDLDANWSHIERLVNEASEQAVRLLVLPEACQVSFASKDVAEIAEHYTPVFLERLRQLVIKNNIYLVAGIVALPENRADHRVCNQLVVFNADGELMVRYNKIHPYDAFSYKESDRICSGHPDQIGIFDIGDFRFGLINCYDLRFPELARRLIDKGVNVLSVSAAWIAGQNKEAHWEILNRARAIENTAYVLASGQSPKRSCGHSMIIDPMGNILSGVGNDGLGMAVAELDYQKIISIRQENPCLENRKIK
ncbi:nitrilase-related carbon-nitrogen hydrolase [Basilea psittacipulmonis]|uniref:CN hydrolase domain-containing protein n=1 Tax=Basilea psittacipulmonis DSM 24701 TaxID=1072685 RepID=A0A077DDG8_9BURK|nr:nitrilase-related carbon-nitrogen hydrolase [Basilea psittacipulmonis]AIL32905.1 hypothetical protein IX83_05850 [Basilea psittacipulmonis DSM 24701]